MPSSTSVFRKPSSLASFAASARLGSLAPAALGHGYQASICRTDGRVLPLAPWSALRRYVAAFTWMVPPSLVVAAVTAAACVVAAGADFDVVAPLSSSLTQPRASAAGTSGHLLVALGRR